MMRLQLPALVITLASACTACIMSSTPAAAGPKHPAHDLAMAEFERLVNIEVICADGTAQGGSGVRVGGTAVLTAAHVIICEDSAPTMILAQTLDANGAADGHYIATLEGMDIADIARLDVILLPEMPPVAIAAARVGERACAVFSLPEPGRRCGEVWPGGNTGAAGLHVDFVAEHGNSGSGVWDESGHLIGLLDTLRMCSGTNTAQVCTAGVTPLSGRRWIAASATR